MEFSPVTAVAKANVYYEGRVVSHTIVMSDGSRKTLGVIFPGVYHFDTSLPEHTIITAGACVVTLDGETTPRPCEIGTAFDVPADSGFAIAVEDGLCQYVCSFVS